MKRLLGVVAAVWLAAGAAAAKNVVLLRVNEIIHPVTAEYIAAGIDHAMQVNADGILIELDTPGGLGSSMRQIIDKIINSRVPVIVYVWPAGSRAASAGFYILESADIAVMTPGTNTGAASPIALTPWGTPLPLDETTRKKVTSDAAAYLRSIAGKRGRNTEAGEKAVTEAKSWTEKEALDAKLIDAIAQSPEQIFQQFDGKTITRFDGRSETLSLKGASIEPFEMTARQRFLSRVLEPNIAFLLLIAGILGLYVEFSHPGWILPGVAGAISLLLALFALNLLPVNYAGVLLILLALVLFVLEAKFVSHGVLATGGVLAMVFGAVMLFESPVPEMGVRWGTAISVAIPFAAITIFLLRLVLKSRAWKMATGAEEMVGEIGEVRHAIEGEGVVFIHGENWRAISEQKIPAGMKVRVVSVEGLKVRVESISTQAPPSSQRSS